MAYGLLQHDMVERFLLHFFAMAAHTYTRGTWTTPEATHPDRDVASTAYVAAGVVTAPTYLRWALLFEEPQNKTMWVGKAVPRDWLAPAETPVIATSIPTRYGRISFKLDGCQAPRGSVAGSGGYTATAEVTVAKTFGTTELTTPSGGLRVRFRVPSAHAGKMVSATVGGQTWSDFDPAAETVDFSAAQLGSAELRETGLRSIVATFGPAAGSNV